jgi:acyl dehydratase
MRHGGYRYNPHPESKAAASVPRQASQKELPPVTAPRADWSESLYWDNVDEGDPIPSVTVQLTIQRLVMAAGANRDFNAVHHDTYLTQKTGVPEIYANNGLLQSFWERAVREYIGTIGSIRKLGPFRMRAFNFAGDTLTTSGKVLRKYQEGREKLLELELVTENDRGPSVGPGRVTVALPSRG